MQVCAALRAARSGSSKTAAVSSVGRTPGRWRWRDAVARPGLGHGAGQLRDAALGCAIGNAAGKGAVVCSEAKFTIRPQPFSFIARHQRLAQKERRGKVEAMRHVPALGRDVVGRFARVDARGMDQDVGRAERLGDLRRGLSARRGPPHRPHRSRVAPPAALLPLVQAPRPRARTPTTLRAGRASTSAARRPRPELAPVTQATRPATTERGRAAQPSAVRSKSRRGNTCAGGYRRCGHGLPCLRAAKCAPWPRPRAWRPRGWRAAR
jgi:hypothetical protein